MRRSLEWRGALLLIGLASCEQAGSAMSGPQGPDGGSAAPTVSAVVKYLPGPGNPLPQVQAAAYGTTIVVELSFGRAVDLSDAPPTLVARKGDATLRFDFEESSDPASFAATIEPGELNDGTYVPSIDVRDLDGNRFNGLTFSEPPILLDLTADELRVRQDQVSFIRSPAGNADAEVLTNESGQPVFTIPAGVEFYELGPPDGLDTVDRLPADTFSLMDSDPPVMLRVWGDSSQSRLLASAAPASGTGQWLRSGLRLANADTAYVYVTGLDGAGNESSPVRIQNSWLVSSTSASRDSLSVVTTHENTSQIDPRASGRDIAERLELRSPDGQGLVEQASLAWRRSTLFIPPFGALTYDGARERVVFFGGSAQASETWEWDGDKWLNSTPASGSPPANEGAAMAFDTARRRTVLHTPFGTTWEWDGRVWRDVTGVASGPSRRSRGAMAYDSARERLVLFGGCCGRDADGNSNGLGLADVWEYDGRAWREVTAADSPPGRYAHAMAYDSVRARVVMYGGRSSQSAQLDDLWEWDGTTWSEIDTTAPWPGPLSHHSMAFDTVRNDVILHGVDTWRWDGQGWSRAASDGSPPLNGRMVFDGARGRALLLRAGSDTGEAQTWAWDGSLWQKIAATVVLPSSDHAMAYDRARNRLVLFGGQIAEPGSPFSWLEALDSTWEFDGYRWSDVSPRRSNPRRESYGALVFDTAVGRPLLIAEEGPGPVSVWSWDGNRWDLGDEVEDPPREVVATYDEASEQLVVFGGRLVGDELSSRFVGETWLRSDGSWTRITTGPVDLFDYSMAYDASRDRVVLFGTHSFFVDGRDGEPEEQRSRLPQTWEWDGVAWRRIDAVASPPANGSPSMAYDEGNRRIVAVIADGSERLRAWEWDGQTWTVVSSSTATGPTRRVDHRVAYDVARRSIILTGGRVPPNGPPLSDVWEWDGRDWTDITVDSGGITRRARHAMTYDRIQDRVMVYGGYGVAEALDDTWTWDGTEWRDVTPPKARPTGRTHHAMAFDEARNETVLYGGGGDLTDTWTWDGSAWRRHGSSDAAPTPPPRWNHRMAYDPVRERVVLFGGQGREGELDDTWLWDGRVWSEATPAGVSPSKRRSHGMAFDRSRSQIFMYGGTTGLLGLGDAWTWDGSSWVEESFDDGAIQARFGHGLVFDELRRRSTVFYGRDGDIIVSDAHDWDGMSWRSLPDGGPSPSGPGFSMAYDAGLGRAVLHGADFSPETWHLATPTPGIQFSTRLPEHLDRIQLDDVRVRAFCGGRSTTNTSQETGAELLGWAPQGKSTLGWRALGANETAPDAANPRETLIDFRPPRPAAAALAQSLFSEDDGSMHFQCRPRDLAGHTTAVSMDYLEVRVRYR